MGLCYDYELCGNYANMMIAMKIVKGYVGDDYFADYGNSSYLMKRGPRAHKANISARLGVASAMTQPKGLCHPMSEKRIRQPGDEGKNSPRKLFMMEFE